jgi:hypothetical protein
MPTSYALLSTDKRVTASLSGVASRPMVLTWALPGPGKGIEHAIDATAMLGSRGLHA